MPFPCSSRDERDLGQSPGCFTLGETIKYQILQPISEILFQICQAEVVGSIYRRDYWRLAYQRAGIEYGTQQGKGPSFE